jgi:Tfp pilus assembly protein PilF
MAELSACPLCRSVLSQGARQCPDCGADLTPYLELEQLSTSYVDLTRELLSRGELEAARLVINRLPQLTEIEPAESAELQARLALADGDWNVALSLAETCRPGVSEAIATAVREQQRMQLAARELFNNALTACRRQAFALASRQLSRAVELDPSDPAIWRLKLKADLKCANYQDCYGDLEALDQLAARPLEFQRLEQLLPPQA